jgi:aspartyl aminopeptidase
MDTTPTDLRPDHDTRSGALAASEAPSRDGGDPAHAVGDHRDLLRFVSASPSSYHAVAELRRRLDAAGFARLDERDTWTLTPATCAYVIRDGSIVAFRTGRQAPAEAGFRIVGAHTDSPTFKLRPRHDVRRAGYRLAGVEGYGGLLHHTWMDRDLGVAGRLAVRTDDGGVALRLVHVDEPLLRMPSLAIHLDREVNEGLTLNRQQHLVPLLGSDGDVDLLARVAAAADTDLTRVVGHDLVLADTQPAAVGGIEGRYVFAPRLDNLSSCHAGVCALVDADVQDATQVLVANDHEEVGSASSVGAASGFLGDVLVRIGHATGAGAQDHHRAVANSLLVSADTAHAVHPNYADRHEPEHRPRLGGGPVLKVNAEQRYATDAGSGGWFAAVCADLGVPLQAFVVRGDMPCGSTIGPLTATRTGVMTVDVGNPVLSMHSVREQAAVDDVALLVTALRGHLSTPQKVPLA